MEPTKLVYINKTALQVYLLLVSVITLVMVMISASQLINVGLKTYVFPAADAPAYIERCFSEAPSPVAKEIIVEDEGEGSIAEPRSCEDQRKDQEEIYHTEKARDAVRNFSLLIVALPLFLVHYRLFTSERKKKVKVKKED